MRFPLLVLSLLFALLRLVRAEDYRLSPLGQPPDYDRIDGFEEAIDRDRFERLLREVYAPQGGWQPFISFRGNPPVADFKTHVPPGGIPMLSTDIFHWPLRCATSAATAKTPPRYWRSRPDLPPSPEDGQPLAGIKIALDPGHLGAGWARMEERWFTIGDAPPVLEGEMTLRVARLLADRLRALGATVFLTRDGGEPATDQRPADFREAARAALAARGVKNPPEDYRDSFDPDRLNSLRWEAEHLFFRADIMARARRVNAEFRPDLALCLHFNAEAWGDPAAPTLVDKDHFHVLINGCYSADELAEDDTRCQMLVKLLNGSHPEELAAAETIAGAVARATGLPPYEYTRPNAVRVGPNPYVWARNLLANRLYECPTVYLEPYVMNSPGVFARVQAGDYDGEREVAGARRPSIFREYADGVAAGVRAHFQRRGRTLTGGAARTRPD